MSGPQIKDSEGFTVGEYDVANGTIESCNGTLCVDCDGLVTDSNGNFVGRIYNGTLEG